ncbi:MAG: VCBS repeat-containing protein [Candidatus Electryoneaceae bacterium]|nr:VCBS repeat-containing protein [Candidatus Electryoneaceae bacterium]
MDNDGDMDLLVGDSDGYITLYIRDDEGNLSSAGHIEADGEEMDMEDRAAPDWVDWDLDGDFDLLIGSSTGAVTLYINEGDEEETDFNLVGNIEADDEEIWLGSETAPAFGDMDGDGVRDLIVGSIFGEMWLYPNIGEDDDPQFGAGIQLSDEDGAMYLVAYSRPELMDWDDDGDLDIVSGLIDSEIRLYINPGVESAPSEQNRSPVTFTILTNYPEPFNHHTTLLFQNDRNQAVTVDILTVAGKRIRTMDRGRMSIGRHRINLDMIDLSCGRYFVQFRTQHHAAIRPVTLVK